MWSLNTMTFFFIVVIPMTGIQQTLVKSIGMNEYSCKEICLEGYWMKVKKHLSAKWNKPDIGIQILCDLTYVWNLKKVEPIEPECRMLVAREYGVGEMRRYWSKGINCQLKDEKLWALMYNMVVIGNNTILNTQNKCSNHIHRNDNREVIDPLTDLILVIIS